MYTSSNIVLHFSKFINNSAHSGGAIYARDNGAVTLNGTITSLAIEVEKEQCMVYMILVEVEYTWE